jgi:hypothetical protein
MASKLRLWPQVQGASVQRQRAASSKANHHAGTGQAGIRQVDGWAGEIFRRLFSAKSAPSSIIVHDPRSLLLRFSSKDVGILYSASGAISPKRACLACKSASSTGALVNVLTTSPAARSALRSRWRYYRRVLVQPQHRRGVAGSVFDQSVENNVIGQLLILFRQL